MSRAPDDSKSSYRSGKYTEPKPPPAELGFDPAKWNTMSRAERRAVLRHARKQERS